MPTTVSGPKVVELAQAQLSNIDIEYVGCQVLAGLKKLFLQPTRMCEVCKTRRALLNCACIQVGIDFFDLSTQDVFIKFKQLSLFHRPVVLLQHCSAAIFTHSASLTGVHY
jgi:hypothetical protein